MVASSKPPVFEARDEAGRVSCRMGEDPDTGLPFAEFLRPDGHRAIHITQTPSGPAILMLDTEGAIRATLSIVSGKSPYLLLFDEAGNVVAAVNPDGQPPPADPPKPDPNEN